MSNLRRRKHAGALSTDSGFWMLRRGIAMCSRLAQPAPSE